ncbi:MAG: hypothetical protein EG823_03685 [Actinobacteria bacterium]|nr:hypothetical protein [Actinomycetota bacterium]
MTGRTDTRDMLHARAQFYECDTFDDFLEQLRAQRLCIGAARAPGLFLSRAKLERKLREARDLFGDSSVLEWLDDQLKYRPREEKESNR